jgi:hypothetical protein
MLTFTGIAFALDFIIVCLTTLSGECIAFVKLDD